MIMVLRGFTDELVKLAERERKSPSILKGLAAGGVLGGAAGFAGLAGDPQTKILAGLRAQSGEIGKILPFLKATFPGIAEAAREIVKAPPMRHSHITIPALTGAALAGGWQGLRKLRHAQEKRADASQFLQSPTGAMLAAHMPLGGPVLGAMRAGRGHRVSGAIKGSAGETIGNAGGALAGLLAAKVIEHTLLHGAAPSWLSPAAIAGGGLIGGPAIMHLMTRGKSA